MQLNRQRRHYVHVMCDKPYSKGESLFCTEVIAYYYNIFTKPK